MATKQDNILGTVSVYCSRSEKKTVKIKTKNTKNATVISVFSQISCRELCN